MRISIDGRYAISSACCFIYSCFLLVRKNLACLRKLGIVHYHFTTVLVCHRKPVCVKSLSFNWRKFYFKPIYLTECFVWFLSILIKIWRLIWRVWWPGYCAFALCCLTCAAKLIPPGIAIPPGMRLGPRGSSGDRGVAVSVVLLLLLCVMLMLCCW